LFKNKEGKQKIMMITSDCLFKMWKENKEQARYTTPLPPLPPNSINWLVPVQFIEDQNNLKKYKYICKNI